MRLRVASKHIPLLATAAVLGVLYLAGCIAYRNFSSPRVAVDLLGDNAFLGVAAVGATFVILSGGIDLSVGAVVAFTGILIAALLNPGQKGVHPLLAWLLGPDGLPHLAPWLISPGGVHPLAAILIALVLGSVFGAALGALIHFFRLPPFLVTLAGMFFARGMGFVIYPQSLGIKHPFYVRTINQDLALRLTEHVTFPFTAVCFVAVLAAAIFLAHYTRFGRSVYAIGGDEQSATLMGLAIGRTKILIYTFAGFCSALAGVVYTFYMQSGNPAGCVGLELDAIASVVIGGTLLSGGVGFVAGTAMGVLILGLIQTLITFQGNLNTWWTKIAVGILVLVFILLQNVISAATGRAGARSGRA